MSIRQKLTWRVMAVERRLSGQLVPARKKGGGGGKQSSKSEDVAPKRQSTAAPVPPVEEIDIPHLKERGLFRGPENVPALDELGGKTKAGKLDSLNKWLGKCSRCVLHKECNHIVFGEGNAEARLVFVGEGPGADEDATGRPFVGRAGQLLDKMIEAMGLRREEVYICNVVKCRPPNNRAPNTDEVAVCGPVLFRQLEIIQPELIVSLGSPALVTLLERKEGITKMRGRLFRYGKSLLLPTYHPAYLLRNPPEKKTVWQDLKLACAVLGIAPKS